MVSITACGAGNFSWKARSSKTALGEDSRKEQREMLVADEVPVPPHLVA